VDNAGLMRGFKRIGNVDGDGKKRFRFHRAPRDAVPKRYTVKKLHHDEGPAIFLADFVDGTNIRVVESRGGQCLALKTGQGLSILDDVIGEKLERDEAAKDQVLGFVNNAHSAAAHLLNDAVARDGLAD